MGLTQKGETERQSKNREEKDRRRVKAEWEQVEKRGDVKIEEWDRYREAGRGRKKEGSAIGGYKLPLIQQRRLDISYLSSNFGMPKLQRLKQ